MSAIDTQNAKSIRDSMQIVVTVGESSNPLFQFTNADIISCDLELRSDLKAIDPTLPESEITIRAYYPEDVSEDVITIADDTVITYQSGYEGDMSPVRTFYLAEQIQWADNIITIHGVDAVHFLDIDMPPFFLGSIDASYSSFSIGVTNETWSYISPFTLLLGVFSWCIENGTGITITSFETPYTFSTSTIAAKNVASVIERQSRRDVIANLMNLCHQEYAANVVGTTARSLWLTYVDAGRPRILTKKPASSWTIYETDCGDIKRHVDKNIVRIDAKTKSVDVSLHRGNMVNLQSNKPKVNTKIGTVEIFNNGGGAYKYDCLASILDLGIPTSESTPENPKYLLTWGAPADGYVLNHNRTSRGYTAGKWLRDEKDYGWQDWGTSWQGIGYSYDLSDLWESLSSAGYAGLEKGNITVDLLGGAYILTDTSASYSITGTGIVAKPDHTTWCGKLYAGKYNSSSTTVKVLPDEGFKSLMQRSNETGSFTWKGDPRMQPRDVFTFVYRDGTEELRTIETISLKHEGGGTVAEITYRKGIV